MIYLEKFELASALDEDGFILSYPYQLEMQCYSHTNVYPFKIFPPNFLRRQRKRQIHTFEHNSAKAEAGALRTV